MKNPEESKRESGADVGSIPLLGPWKLWSENPPKEPGLYWLAGYFPADETLEASTQPEEPIVWDVKAREISGECSVRSIHGYNPENLVWCGPLIAPGFGPNKQ